MNSTAETPNQALQPTPGSAFSSAARFTFTDPAWLSLGRSADRKWVRRR
jgi:hypothetical protein